MANNQPVFDNGTCTIGLEPHVNKSHPPCGHVFHFHCLSTWCQIRLECPVCKEKFTIFMHSIDGDTFQVETPEQLVNPVEDGVFRYLLYDQNGLVTKEVHIYNTTPEFISLFVIYTIYIYILPLWQYVLTTYTHANGTQNSEMLLYAKCCIMYHHAHVLWTIDKKRMRVRRNSRLN